jgi:hypothetical protein
MFTGPPLGLQRNIHNCDVYFMSFLRITYQMLDPRFGVICDQKLNDIGLQELLPS